MVADASVTAAAAWDSFAASGSTAAAAATVVVAGAGEGAPAGDFSVGALASALAFSATSCAYGGFISTSSIQILKLNCSTAPFSLIMQNCCPTNLIPANDLVISSAFG